MNTPRPTGHNDLNGKPLFEYDPVILYSPDSDEFRGFIHFIDNKPFIRAMVDPKARPGERIMDFDLSRFHAQCATYAPDQELTPFTTADELYSLIAPYTSRIYFEDAQGNMMQVKPALRINLDGEVVIRLEEKE